MYSQYILVSKYFLHCFALGIVCCLLLETALVTVCCLAREREEIRPQKAKLELNEYKRRVAMPLTVLHLVGYVLRSHSLMNARIIELNAHFSRKIPLRRFAYVASDTSINLGTC